MKPRRPVPPRKIAAAPLLVTIEKAIYGGNFLARDQGKAIFVPLVLPGEQVRVHVVDDKPKRGYAIAELDEIVIPSSERIEARCPHFGPCGGCNYQHAGYDQQVEFKQAVLRETFDRAGIVLPAMLEVLSAEPWEYRNRIRVAFDAAGQPGYRGRRSHQVVAIDECPISAPLLVRAALATAAVLREFHLRPAELALFCDAAETALLATIFVSHPAKLRLEEIAAAVQLRIPELAGMEVALESEGEFPRTLQQWGQASIQCEAAGQPYRVDQGAFFQVNRRLVDALVDSVVGERTGGLAWDLFAGVGLFARPLTQRFQKVVAVESAPAAVKALASNLCGTSGEAIAASTLDFLLCHADDHPDLVVVDPPRTGLGAEITSLLARVAAPALMYVSCDPATMARDLRPLLASGYSVESVTLADLFPQTFHLETVVRLRRN